MADQDGTTMEKIASLAKRRGFIFQGSEIYDGLAGTWDYGPLGVTLKNNIIREWWKMFVEDRTDMYGVDAAILMNPRVWEASGHTGAGFADPMVECLACQHRFRVDHLINEKKYEDYLERIRNEVLGNIQKIIEKIDEHEDIIDYLNSGVENEKLIENLREESRELKSNLAIQELASFEFQKAQSYTGSITKSYLDLNTDCPVCKENKWGTPRKFNMMFRTHIGPMESDDNIAYLRPETAQGIFVNFKNVVDTMHPKLPFGIAQVGKAFRNEIAPREFLFRAREFEQMEIEYFVKESEWEEHFEAWRELVRMWSAHIGLSADDIREYDVPADDLAHYSKRTIDFEYNYPGKGFDELLGLAYRTDHDLTQHQEASGVSQAYIEQDGSRFIPHVIEPSFGLGRTFMAVLSAAYTEDEMNGESRVFLKLPAHLAPNRIMVSPLLKNKPELVEKAREVFTSLKQTFGNVAWDDNGNVGKRYRRQDEIGTPHCVTIDFDTLEDDTVTVRDRDTGEQQRVAITELATFCAA